MLIASATGEEALVVGDVRFEFVALAPVPGAIVVFCMADIASGGNGAGV